MSNTSKKGVGRSINKFVLSIYKRYIILRKYTLVHYRPGHGDDCNHMSRMISLPTEVRFDLHVDALDMPPYNQMQKVGAGVVNRTTNILPASDLER